MRRYHHDDDDVHDGDDDDYGDGADDGDGDERTMGKPCGWVERWNVVDD